jgi:hypothetical protein
MIALVKYILFDFRGVGLCRHKLQKFTVIVEQSAIGYSNKSSSLVLVAGRWVSWSCWHCYRHKCQSHMLRCDQSCEQGTYKDMWWGGEQQACSQSTHDVLLGQSRPSMGLLGGNGRVASVNIGFI